jgi:DNA-binding PucR family transcriptional regulator
VALAAAALQDPVLAASLHQLYVAPLAGRQKDRVAVRETLRTYFANGRSLTATAAVLNVARQTVRSRLRTAEERLSRPLDDCTPEVEVALSLEEIVEEAAHGRTPAPLAASQ